MEKFNYSKSIALIGPKAVGKSLIVSRLLKRYPEYSVFSSDKLENYAMMFYQGDFRSVEEIKALVKSEYTDERALKKTKLADKEEVLRRNRAYVDDYLKSLDFFGDHADFLYLKRLLRQTIEIMTTNKNLSLKQMLFIMQYQKIIMLESVLENMDMPLIFDLGADMGSFIKIEKKEKQQLEAIFGMSMLELRKKQEDFFAKIGRIVYLEPGIDYKSKVDPRSNDEHNQIYFESDKSYIDFADISITMNDLFNDATNMVFRNDNDFDVDIVTQKERLMDKGNLENICDLIMESIENLNENGK